MIFKKKDKKGFLVLSLVLLVSAVVLAVSTGILLRSLSDSNSSTYEAYSSQAGFLANACGEYAVKQLSTTDGGLPGWDYSNVGGTTLEDLDAEGNSCYIYAIAASGTAKLVKVSAEVQGFYKKLLIEVATNTPTVVISSWKEVPDFE